MSNEYDWHARIISKNRITVPDMIVREWGLNEGDIVHVNIRRSVKLMRDVII
uniref:Antitoxin family protein n=1 Tax=viral metagenome TaxID=1070528 RepID=A0A6M3Y5H6_9ZZZZ